MSEPDANPSDNATPKSGDAAVPNALPEAGATTPYLENVRTRVEPIKASIVLGFIAIFFFGSMFLTEDRSALFNLQILVVILVIALLATVWLVFLIAGPAVAQLRGKIGDFGIDVGGPIAAFLGTAVLLFLGYSYSQQQAWSIVPEKDPTVVVNELAALRAYRETIPTAEQLSRISEVLDEFPPKELERITMLYSDLVKRIDGDPLDTRLIGDLVQREKQDRRLRNRISGQYCYFARHESDAGEAEPKTFVGRLSIQNNPEARFVMLKGRANGAKFESSFFSVLPEGVMYQWMVEDRRGVPRAIGFADLDFEEFGNTEDRLVTRMGGSYLTYGGEAGDLRLVRNVADGGRSVDYCSLIARDMDFD